MSTTQAEVTEFGPDWWRASIAGLAASAAVVLLAAMTVSLVRVAWFVETSEYCQTVTCTGTAMRAVEAAADGRSGELMVQGEAAFRSAGASDLMIALGYLPLTTLALAAVVVLLAVAALSWGWAPWRWRQRWPLGTTRAGVRVLAGVLSGLGIYVVIFLFNLQSMLWITHVTE